ncbi:hypothetical protein GCM10008931_43670 [Oceanobacillus oncorhynchi subsp. oncorhynchi]|uniref:hypothetical protein n=1 Tax=Oceanobacillus oncorhynchi TaxID=545501 RepID=UPI0031D94208
MKTFIHDMKVLKYHKEAEVKNIILFCCGMAFVAVVGKLLQAHKMINPIFDPILFLLIVPSGIAFWIILYSIRYVALDRKMLREYDKEFDAEKKWSSLLRDFNKKSDL